MNKKLMILTIVTVMAALISLGGRQALSKRSFDANYYAEFDGDIVGEGPVKWSSKFVGSDARTDDYELEFSEVKGFDWGEFAGTHWGWLAMVVDKQSGMALFEYRWSDEQSNNYDLSGYGYFESNKKEKSFTFTSEGEYKLVQWWHGPPYLKTLWGDKCPIFTIFGTQLEDND